MKASISKSTKFWSEQDALQAAVAGSNRTTRAACVQAMENHLSDKGEDILPKDVLHWLYSMSITDQSTEAQQIAALVAYVAEDLIPRTTWTKKFAEVVASDGPLQAIDRFGEYVSKEAGENEMKAKVVKMLDNRVPSVTTVADLLTVLKAIRDELLWDVMDMSPACSTSMFYNAIATWKRDGARKVFPKLENSIGWITRFSLL